MSSNLSSQRIKTLNNMGNMVLFSNPTIDSFLDHVEKSKGIFADIGAAYGNSTLEALKRGGHVKAIDLDQRHLDILVQNCPPKYQSELMTECGHFPNTINLDSNTYDGILFSRVLIFLTPSEINIAFSKIYAALKKGGVVYIVSASPFRKKWDILTPIYEDQKLKQVPWPGKINNLWGLVPEEKNRLPNSIQLIDSPSLQEGLCKAGFNVVCCDYYPTITTSEKEAFELTYAIASK